MTIYNLSEAAIVVGQSRQTLKSYAGTDALPADKDGNYWTIKSDDLEAYAKEKNLKFRPERLN